MPEIRATSSFRTSVEGILALAALPANTPERVANAVERLAIFPDSGTPIRELGDVTLRAIMGPWRWLWIFYTHDPNSDVVLLLRVEDLRSSTPLRPRGEDL